MKFRGFFLLRKMVICLAIVYIFVSCTTTPKYENFSSLIKENEKAVYFFCMSNRWTLRIVTNQDGITSLKEIPNDSNWILNVDKKINPIIIPINGVAVFSLPKNINQIAFIPINLQTDISINNISGITNYNFTYTISSYSGVLPLSDDEIQGYALIEQSNGSLAFQKIDQGEIETYFSKIKNYGIGSPKDQLGFIYK